MSPVVIPYTLIYIYRKKKQIKENFGDDIAKYENTTRHLLDSETTQKSSKISFYNSQ